MDLHSTSLVLALTSTNAEQLQIFAMRMHHATMRLVDIHAVATMVSLAMDIFAHQHQPKRSMSQ